MQTLLDTSLFVPSSVNTKLGDDTVIVCLGNDKGGKDMQFKFGFTVMNQPMANSVESFDICTTMDAVDTYQNLRRTILNDKTGWKNEMEILFNLEDVPHFLIVKNKFDECILVTLLTKIPSQRNLETNEKVLSNVGIVDVTEGKDQLNVTGLVRMEDDSFIALGTRNNEVLGIVFMTREDDESIIHSIIKLDQRISTCEITSLSLGVMELHTFLSGDIEFLSNVLGHQGCPASFTCYYCYVKLDLL